MFSTLRKSKFFISVSTLSTGTVVSNAITIVASVFLTRLYSPGDIGQLTFFNSIAIVIANILTLGYEFAIVVPKKDRTALKLLAGVTGLLLSLSMILMLLTILLLFTTELNFIPGIPIKWVILIPLASLLLGLINISQEWYTRTENFGLLSKVKVAQSFSTSLSQISFAYAYSSGIGLLLGYLIGRIIASAYYIYGFVRGSLLKVPNGKDVLKTLKKFRAYPKYISITVILDRFSLEAPFFLISIFFSENLLGLYAIAYRVLSVPMTVLGSAIGQVFFKHLTAKKHLDEKLQPALIKTWTYLAIIGILPMLIILFGSEELFGFVFGDDWRFSGTLATLLVPMLYLDFISSPTGRSFLVLELEKYTPIFSIARITYISVSIYIGFLYSNIILAVLLFSLSRSIALIIQNAILYLKAREYDNRR